MGRDRRRENGVDAELVEVALAVSLGRLRDVVERPRCERRFWRLLLGGAVEVDVAEVSIDCRSICSVKSPIGFMMGKMVEEGAFTFDRAVLSRVIFSPT